MVSLRNGKNTDNTAKYFGRPKATYTHEFIMSSYREMFAEFEKTRGTTKLNEQSKWIKCIIQFTAILPAEWINSHMRVVNESIAACERNILQIKDYLNDPDPRLDEFVNRTLFQNTLTDLEHAQRVLETRLTAL